MHCECLLVFGKKWTYCRGSLVELSDDALILSLMNGLKQKLPVGLTANRWQREIVNCAIVVNIDKWNTHFSALPVIRVS